VDGEAERPALRALSDENVVEAFSRLIPHYGSPAGGRRSFGGATAIVTGMPAAFFNPIVCVGPSLKPDDLEAAVTWSRAQGVRPAVAIRNDLDDRIAPTAGDLGFEAQSWSMPGMALRLDSVDPAPPPHEIQLRVVATTADLEDWHAVIESGPDYRRAFGPSMLEDRAVRLVVGAVDGQPVTAAAAIRTDGAVGVYSVVTANDARRRGYGRAVTWAAIEAGRAAWQSEVAVLQSSEMGFSVYQAMGFVVVCRYVLYVEPA
jgi:hypothetical protein